MELWNSFSFELKEAKDRPIGRQVRDTTNNRVRHSCQHPMKRALAAKRTSSCRCLHTMGRPSGHFLAGVHRLQTQETSLRAKVLLSSSSRNTDPHCFKHSQKRFPPIMKLHLLLLCQLPLVAVTAWVSTNLQTHQRQTTFLQSSSPFFAPEEEFECPDEEECEIDWDTMMPSWGEDEEESTTRQVEQTELLSLEDVEEEKEFQVDHSRVRLEMNWQLDECPRDSCVEDCPTCEGSGLQECRFCQGRKVISFNGSMRSCLICGGKGVESCSTCKGTGSVAPWVTTLEDFLAKNNSDESPSTPTP